MAQRQFEPGAVWGGDTLIYRQYYSVRPTSSLLWTLTFPGKIRPLMASSEVIRLTDVASVHQPTPLTLSLVHSGQTLAKPAGSVLWEEAVSFHWTLQEQCL